jgi:protein-disulfide isomerase
MSTQNATENDTLNFQIKRSHFYAITIPLAFLLGLALGYMVWGQGTVAPLATAASGGENSPVGSELTDPQAPQSDDIASQIASIERIDVTVDKNDPTYGPEDAPITIIEFADFQCPFCQRHFQETYPQLLENYPDQIRFVYKDYPLTSIHPDAFPASLAGMCAYEQDAFWPFHDLLYGGTLGLGSEAYSQYASDLGLDMDAFAQCIEEERFAEDVQADAQYAQQIGVSSTPTFFINGLPIVGAQPYSLFAQVIDYELANQ